MRIARWHGLGRGDQAVEHLIKSARCDIKPLHGSAHLSGLAKTGIGDSAHGALLLLCDISQLPQALFFNFGARVFLLLRIVPLQRETS